MSGNFAIKGGGVGPQMANAILNFHFDFLHPSLSSTTGRFLYSYIPYGFAWSICIFLFAQCVLRKTDLPFTKCVRWDKWQWRDEGKLDDKQIFVYAQKVITMNVS